MLVSLPWAGQNIPCTTSFIWIFFSCGDPSPNLFEGAAFLVNSTGLGLKGLSLPLLSSLSVSIFFFSKGTDFIHLLQGLQVADFVKCSFLNVCKPLSIHTVSSTSVVCSGRVQQKNLNRKSQVGFSSQAIVCKNIYAGFIQFLLEDHWKPMWTNSSLVLKWCERVMVLSIICLILNLSLNFMVTDFGKFILFPLKIMLTSFQSISIISQM